MRKYTFMFNGKRNKAEKGEIFFSLTTDDHKLIKRLEEDLYFTTMIAE